MATAPTPSLIYIDKIPAAIRALFALKVQAIASRLGVQPNWLMQVMKAESGLNPQAVNKQAGDSADPYTRAAKRATGLIQFMPSTAKGLGTTTQAIYQMDALKQLDYVEKYFKGYAGKMKSYYDVYFVVFFPAAIGKNDDWVFQTKDTSAATIAKQNPAVNLNKDGKITVAEFKQYIRSTVPKTIQDLVFSPAIGLAGILFFFSSLTV